MSAPYRTPAAAPAPCTPPSWRRRLAATLPLPTDWRWVRAARGGAWERAECVPEWCGCGRNAHDRGRWQPAPHPQRETVQRLSDVLVMRSEDHGPPVAPLRWTWPRVPRLGLWWGPVGALGLVALWGAALWCAAHCGWSRVVAGALAAASLGWTGWVARRAERE